MGQSFKTMVSSKSTLNDTIMVTSGKNYRLGVIMTCQWEFINCNKCTFLVEDATVGQHVCTQEHIRNRDEGSAGAEQGEEIKEERNFRTRKLCWDFYIQTSCPSSSFYLTYNWRILDL